MAFAAGVEDARKLPDDLPCSLRDVQASSLGIGATRDSAQRIDGRCGDDSGEAARERSPLGDRVGGGPTSVWSRMRPRHPFPAGGAIAVRL